ncbi:MAG TPA: chitinase, partial [Acidimicrobiales bacterium]|nr:chitinase [Acidimicrobiales bacterium]
TITAMTLLALTPLASSSGSAADAPQPVEMAAPYEYLGWGNPQPPTQVMADTGVEDLTLAFILSKGRCNPTWDGQRPLLGGTDQAAINSIRAAGGDVDVSFGGWSGNKLGNSCQTVRSLAGAYQKVINDYSLHAIDIDIENTEMANPTTRVRVIDALALVQTANPGIEISITFGTNEDGPNPQGRRLVADAAHIGFEPSSWTIMPFDFGTPVSDMGAVSIDAANGLDRDLAEAYHQTDAVAFEHMGISSMSGQTDESDETVSVAEFQTMLAFARSNDLARFTFWSVNRDRSCAGDDTDSSSCSGINQEPYAFTDVVAQYHG